MQQGRRAWAHTLLLTVVLLGALSGCGYNTIVDLEQRVQAAWAQVENQLQRRADLIPNLVNTVKGYAAHERDIMDNIAKARASLLQARSIPDKIDAANRLEAELRELSAAQGGHHLCQAHGRGRWYRKSPCRRAYALQSGRGGV